MCDRDRHLLAQASAYPRHGLRPAVSVSSKPIRPAAMTFARAAPGASTRLAAVACTERPSSDAGPQLICAYEPPPADLSINQAAARRTALSLPDGSRPTACSDTTSFRRASCRARCASVHIVPLSQTTIITAGSDRDQADRPTQTGSKHPGLLQATEKSFTA